MPAARFFIDSNVLLYAHDVNDALREAAAKAWLEALAHHQAGQINLQVLNELAAVLLRKRWLATPDRAFAVVDNYAAFGDKPVSRAEVKLARHLHSRAGYSWWDCILLASALELGCSHFLSEDLQDGQVIDGLTIIDPFRHEPADFFDASA
jgi:predicted nucleic acid-binding protein